MRQTLLIIIALCAAVGATIIILAMADRAILGLINDHGARVHDSSHGNCDQHRFYALLDYRLRYPPGVTTL